MVDTSKRPQSDRGYERIREGPKEAGRTPRGRGEEQARQPVRGTEEEGHRTSRSMKEPQGPAQGTGASEDEDDARQVEEAERKGEVDHAW